MNSEQITRLSHDVNDLLTRYIAIHDDVFRASWRRIVPVRGLFQKIDFHRHFINITEIETSLTAMKAEAEMLSEKTLGADKNYITTLHQYIAALLHAVALFTRIIGRLRAKRDNKEYRWNEYRRDLKTYNRSRRYYGTLGRELNRKWARYSLSNATTARADNSQTKVLPTPGP
jgi:hypothetical protein